MLTLWYPRIRHRHCINPKVPQRIRTTIPHRAIIREPWMTPELMKSSKKRMQLYRKALGKDRLSESFSRYLSYRNEYNLRKRQAKDSYYAMLLHKYDGDIRKQWKVLNSIVGRTKDKSRVSDTFLIEGKKETCCAKIADNFCEYFTNIGKQYAEAIPKSNKLPQQYMNNVPNRDSIFLSPTDPDEILKIIRSFKAKNSSGDDGISMNLLKQISESICVPIASLVNMSLERGIVPNAMKLAKVIPIYKGKCKESFTKYRPISLLSNISKILEKVVHKRLLSFLTRCGILYNSQYGFRPNCSTIDAITEFTANVIPALDNNDKCLSVFLDLSKTFDTINHEILLMKLKRYGIRGVALKWFRSYLNQIMQYVSFKGVHSKTRMVEYGVPQGSVLGPLLFILYSNDIPLSLTHSKAILFADDTTVFCTGSDLEKMYECINSDMDNLNDWFKANQLSVNPSKTKYILFTKRCGVDDQMHNLYIEGTIL